MDCPKCGKEVPANATFCYSCGAVMSSPPINPPAWQRSSSVPAASTPEYSTRKYSPPANRSPYWPYDQPVKKRFNFAFIIRRLPMLGGLLAAAGFFLAWDRDSARSGWDVLQMGIAALSDFARLNFKDPDVISVILRTVLMIGVGLIPLAAITGLLTLRGTGSSRLTAASISLLALLDVALLYVVIIVLNQYPVAELIKTIQPGWYLAVFGLLWMIFSPMFVRKPRGKNSNSYR